MAKKSDHILVAQIGPPHGVRGLMRLKSYTEDPDGLFDYGPLFDADGAVVDLTLQNQKKGHLLVAMAGVSDRDAAEAMKGTRLFVPRDRLPEPDEDEFYQTDLLGLACRLEDGTDYGSIKAVQNFGGGDLLEVKLQTGGPTVFLPFTKAVVPTLKISDGYVIVVPPESVGDPETDAGGK